MKVVELLESKGSQALDFIEYLSSGLVAKKSIPAFKQLGTELFKRGWTFTIKNNPRFHDGNVSGFTVILPYRRAPGTYHNSGLELIYTSDDSDVLKFHTEFFRIHELLDEGLDSALDRVKTKALSRGRSPT